MTAVLSKLSVTVSVADATEDKAVPPAIVTVLRSVTAWLGPLSAAKVHWVIPPPPPPPVRIVTTPPPSSVRVPLVTLMVLTFLTVGLPSISMTVKPSGAETPLNLTLPAA